MQMLADREADRPCPEWHSIQANWSCMQAPSSQWAPHILKASTCKHELTPKLLWIAILQPAFSKDAMADGSAVGMHQHICNAIANSQLFVSTAMLSQEDGSGPI